MVSLLSLFISLRFSRGCYRSGIMISLTSIISTISITLSIAILIVGLSAINGFEREFNKRVLSVVPHGEIEPINQPWKNWLCELQKVTQVHGVVAAAPYITFTGLIENGSNLNFIQVKGIDPQQEEEISTLPQFVENDAWTNFKSGRQQIIIGKGVADALKIKRGDWISIMISKFNNCYKLQQPKWIYLQVVGILHLNSQLDHKFAMVPLEDARTYLNVGNSVTGIAVKVNDVFNADKLVINAGRVTNEIVYVKSWISTYGYMHRDIQMIRIIMYLTMILMIGISCFSIVSMLMIAVESKNSDIAILRTLGAKDSLIRDIFIWYGLLVGIVGSICGIAIGVMISLRLTSIIHSIEQIINHQFLSKNIYFIDFLPSELHCLDIICVLISALLLSLLASWYPAYHASHINPVKILSGR